MVSGQLLAWAGQVASEKCIGNMYPGIILLTCEPLFPPPLYLQSDEVTSVHVPHTWDARDIQSMGGAPHWKDSVPQLNPKARNLENMRVIIFPLPYKVTSGLMQGERETEKAITAPHYIHQDSKI